MLFQLSGRDGDRDGEEWALCLVSVKLIRCGCPGEKHSNDVPCHWREALHVWACLVRLWAGLLRFPLPFDLLGLLRSEICSLGIVATARFQSLSSRTRIRKTVSCPFQLSPNSMTDLCLQQ